MEENATYLETADPSTNAALSWRRMSVLFKTFITSCIPPMDTKFWALSTYKRDSMTLRNSELYFKDILFLNHNWGLTWCTRYSKSRRAVFFSSVVLLVLLNWFKSLLITWTSVSTSMSRASMSFFSSSMGRNWALTASSSYNQTSWLKKTQITKWLEINRNKHTCFVSTGSSIPSLNFFKASFNSSAVNDGLCMFIIPCLLHREKSYDAYIYFWILHSSIAIPISISPVFETFLLAHLDLSLARLKIQSDMRACWNCLT